MPIVQKYRDCKCVKDCYDTFEECVHYAYYPLINNLVGVMNCNDDTLYIMSEELFWENFTDEKRAARRELRMQNKLH